MYEKKVKGGTFRFSSINFSKRARKSLTQEKSRVSVIVCLWDELSFAAFKNYAFHYTTTQF